MSSTGCFSAWASIFQSVELVQFMSRMQVRMYCSISQFCPDLLSVFLLEDLLGLNLCGGCRCQNALECVSMIDCLVGVYMHFECGIQILRSKGNAKNHLYYLMTTMMMTMMTMMTMTMMMMMMTMIMMMMTMMMVMMMNLIMIMLISG